MTDFFAPTIIGLVFLCGLFKKLNIFDVFIEGAKNGLKTAVSIAPVLIGLITVINMLTSSGFIDFLCGILSPFFSVFGLPKDLIPVALLRPVSGSGTLALLEQVFASNPPDSKTGLIGSVLVAGSETTLYTLAVYFGSVGISKTKYALPCALFGDFVGMIMSVLTVQLFCG